MSQLEVYISVLVMSQIIYEIYMLLGLCTAQNACVFGSWCLLSHGSTTSPGRASLSSDRTSHVIDLARLASDRTLWDGEIQMMDLMPFNDRLSLLIGILDRSQSKHCSNSKWIFRDSRSAYFLWPGKVWLFGAKTTILGNRCIR
jgi:hypothetical protein